MQTSSPPVRSHRPRRLRVALAAAVTLATATAAAPVVVPSAPLTALDADLPGLPPVPPAEVRLGDDGFPEPVDPQSWALPEWLGPDEHTPIPGVDWNDPARQPAKSIRAALLVADFPDQPFVVTEEPGSDRFGIDPEWAARVPGYEDVAASGERLANPILDEPVAREDVPQFYADLLNTPSDLNRGRTVNEYWLEDSYGLIGVDVTPFGPYQMDGKEHTYGLGGGDAGGAGAQCPQEDGDACDRSSLVFAGEFQTELITKAATDTTLGTVFNAEDYDFRWLVHAGQDESGTWQEFGEMMFTGPEDVTDEFGPPSPVQQEPAVCRVAELSCPNAAETRYVGWTSWASAEAIWSSAVPGVTSTQAESSGASTYAHELSHIFGVLDNYNNPYGNPLSRSYTGPWAMLSRGTFNGPGGPHARWQIPATQGSTVGAHHMLRNKIRLGFTPPHEVLTLTPELLEAVGPVTADIHPRAYPLAPVTETVGFHGIVIAMGQDESDCDDLPEGEEYRCDGGGYDSTTIEVVDRIGFDSYTPDHGVLVAKAKTGVDLAPYLWAIDAHPEDINSVTGVGRFEGREVYDFIRPGTVDPEVPGSGERAPISLGDYRQLSDALFHAGNAPGVVDEYVDEANGLHVYVLTTARDHDDPGTIGSYRVAVRSLAGHGPVDPATAITGRSDATGAPGDVVELTFTLENSSPVTDIVRLEHDAGGAESARLYDVVEVPALGSTTVSVWVRVGDGAEVSLTATSDLTGEAVTASRSVTAG